MNQCIIGITYLFILYFVIYSIYFLIITILENMNQVQHKKRQKFSNRLKDDYYIPVSILLTTHNDERKIIKKMNELLNLDYSLYEIIIIDDGSTDQTTTKLIEGFHLQKIERPIRKVIKTKNIKEIYQTIEHGKKITLLKKEYGEKYDAINAGINASSYPYFISIDTGFTLPKNTLGKLFSPILENDNIIACSGITEVGNIKKNEEDSYSYLFPKKLLAKGQILEYSRASYFTKSQEADLVGLKSLTLFKKETVLQVLGHDPNSSGENFELIGKIKEACTLQKEKCILKYAPNAIGFIEPFQSVTNILQERKKWIQGLRKNKKRKVQPRNKLLYIFFLLYELYAPYIKIIGIFFTLLACILNLIDFKIILLFFLSYHIVIGTLSLYTLDENLQKDEYKTKIDIGKMIYSAFIERTIYNIIITIGKITILPRDKK